MEWFWKNLGVGVLAAIIGGAILTVITQHGGWSWHDFLVRGTASGVAVGTWKIVGTAKVLMILAVVLAAAAVVTLIVAFFVVPLLLM
jgi:hypothetical protein